MWKQTMYAVRRLQAGNACGFARLAIVFVALFVCLPYSHAQDMVCSGTSQNIDQYRKPYPYRLPAGKYSHQIIGIGIAGSNDHVYVWFKE
jgi:hypothetical protein